MPQKIAVITGPTAAGKTRLGILLAQRLNAEIVSGDSMQLYRGMDIGTAKPTPDELAAAPHHLIDVAEPDEEWSVSRYVEAADAAVRDWSNKLWWPQLEALYAHLVCVQAGGGEAHRDWFRKLHDYTFSTFPNPDKQVGEWLQLRDRAGRPLDGPVGGRLPVKDPYHITRALYLLARRLA